MFGLGAGEIAIIAILVLIIFGGKKIPQLGSGLAKGIQNFKRGLKKKKKKKRARTTLFPKKRINEFYLLPEQ